MLEKLCKKFNADKLDSDLAMHFLDVYEQHFSTVRMRPMKILEIGVHHGGSLKMWADYFPKSMITGVDIDKSCKQHETERVQVIIGDQASVGFLNTLGHFDIIVDDGGHTMVQQITSLEVLWEHLNPGGTYVIEDLETSYWPQFGGAYGKKDTMMELLKSRVDNLNWRGLNHARAEKERRQIPDYHIRAIHFYPSLCLLCKEAACG